MVPRLVRPSTKIPPCWSSGSRTQVSHAPCAEIEGVRKQGPSILRNYLTKGHSKWKIWYGSIKWLLWLFFLKKPVKQFLIWKFKKGTCFAFKWIPFQGYALLGHTFWDNFLLFNSLYCNEWRKYPFSYFMQNCLFFDGKWKLWRSLLYVIKG